EPADDVGDADAEILARLFERPLRADLSGFSAPDDLRVSDRGRTARERAIAQVERNGARRRGVALPAAAVAADAELPAGNDRHVTEFAGEIAARADAAIDLAIANDADADPGAGADEDEVAPDAGFIVFQAA